MLPDVLSSSYKRYKEDTNIFTTWLSQTARACGYKPVETQEVVTSPTSGSSNVTPKAPRLKGRERKLAKEAAKNSQQPEPKTDHETPATVYKLTTVELLRQATTISNWPKGKVAVPASVQRVLHRAISARRRCAAWFDETGVQNSYSREGHSYFIQVLQKASDLLEAASGQTSVISDKYNGKNNAGGNNEVEGNSVVTTRNLFSVLSIEDQDDDLDEAVDISASDITTFSSDTKPTSAQQKAPARGVYEVEVDDLYEVAFMVYCFFEDIQRLRAEVLKTWTEFHDGNLDILAATVVTTAALEIVRKAEDEIYTVNARVFPPSDRTYQDLVNTIFYAEAISRPDDPDEARSAPRALEITPFDEFILIPTGRSLTKFARLREAIDKCAWPPPVPPMRFSYIICPEMLESARMQKFEQDDYMLSQILLDMALADDMKPLAERAKKETAPGSHERKELESIRNIASPFEDGFIDAIRTLWTTGNVSVRSVFAANLLLSIHELHGSTFHGQKMLLDAKTQTENTFEFQFDGQGNVDTGGGIRWSRPDIGLVMNICQRTRYHMETPLFAWMKKDILKRRKENDQYDKGGPLEDLDPKMRETVEARLRADGWTPPEQKHVDNAKKLNIKMIKPNDDMYFLINHNPLYVGTLLLDIATLTEDAGIALANHQMTIFSIAHIYNALTKLNVIEENWVEMDKVISLHTGPLFAGDIPTTPRAMFDRFHYRVNIRASNRKTWKLGCTPATQTLRKFFEIQEPLPRLLHQLESQAQSHRAVIASSLVESTKSDSRKNELRKQLTPVQTLAKLRTYITAVLPDMTVDYITLTKTCQKLLRKIRLAIQDELNYEYPRIIGPGETNDAGFLYLTAGILKDNLSASRDSEKKKERGAFKAGPHLEITGNVIRDFLGDGGSSFVI